MNFMSKLTANRVLGNYYHRIFILIFFLGVVLRLWHITNPLLDQHAWRQSSSAIVARNYLSDMNLFHPRVDMLMPGYPSAFGFYEYYVALLAKIVGFSDPLGRSFTLFVSLVGFIYLYRLVGRFFGPRAALWASAFYAFFPVSAFYSRAFMTDSCMVGAGIVFLFYFTRWVEENRASDYWLSIVSGFFMFSFKIVALYMLVPATIYLYMFRRFRFLTDVRYYALITLSTALPLFYHYYVPVASGGFYNSAILHQDKWGSIPMWLSFEFWFKTFLPWGNLWEYQYMHAGYILLVLGIFKKVEDRRQWLLYGWMGGVFLFFFVAAKGMHHEYYSLPLMPIACAFIGRFLGDFYGDQGGSRKRNRFVTGLVGFMVFYAFVFSLIRLHDRYDIRSNAQYIPMAKIIQENSRPDDLVFLSTKGFEELQYLCHRRGVHIRPPFTSPRAILTSFTGETAMTVPAAPAGMSYRIIAIADYNLARDEPGVYAYLKDTFDLIYERENEYIFRARPNSPGAASPDAL